MFRIIICVVFDLMFWFCFVGYINRWFVAILLCDTDSTISYCVVCYLILSYVMLSRLVVYVVYYNIVLSIKIRNLKINGEC